MIVSVATIKCKTSALTYKKGKPKKEEEEMHWKISIVLLNVRNTISF
jgi:hypothetical protein